MRPTLNPDGCSEVMDPRQNELTMSSYSQPLGIELDPSSPSEQPKPRKVMWRISVICLIALGVSYLVLTAFGLVFVVVVKLLCAWLLFAVLQDKLSLGSQPRS